MSAKPRNITLDIMKGLGILIIIFDHCDPIPFELRRVMMSFMMPMFFLLGGYLYKPVPDIWRDVKKAFCRLVLPYVAGVAVIALLGIFYWRDRSCTDGLEMLVSAAGVDCFYCRYCASWQTVGAFWFFMAMFWCRVVFNTLWVKGGRFRYIWITLVAVAGYLLLRFVIRLPLGVSEGLSLMGFYLIGHLFAHYRQRIHPTALSLSVWAALAVWIWTLRYSSVICSAGFYQHHVLNIIGACGATYAYALLCRGIAAYLPKLTRLLAFAGGGSLFLLWIHKISLHIVFTWPAVFGLRPAILSGGYVILFLCLQWLFCLALLLVATQSPSLCSFFGIYVPPKE